MKVKLSDIAYTRSGDKGPNANIGVIFINDTLYNWALNNFTDKVVKNYLKDIVKGNIIRYTLPNLNALNFILNDCLEGGGSETLVNDAQGKTFGQSLSMIELDVPKGLLNDE